MPLQVPDLDARSFEDLVREARLRIPRYCPEWTDLNDSDPGIAVVQLFAWFTELMLYQLNRVPDRNYLKFLELLNLQPNPPVAATAYVTFTPAANNPQPNQTVHTGDQLRATPPAGDPVTFEATQDLDLIPYPLVTVMVFNGADFNDYSQQNARTDQPFRPFGVQPQLGHALYLGFQPTDKQAKAPGPPFPVADPPFPDRLVLRIFQPPPRGTPDPVPAGDPPPQGSQDVQLVWEYHAQSDEKRWLELAPIEDQTQAFLKEGNWILTGPRDIVPTNEGKFLKPEERRFWLRCRFAGGSYPDAEPQVAFLRANAVPVENLLTVTDEEVGTSDGATTSYLLAQRPVVADSLRLVVRPPERGDDPDDPKDTWTQVEDFLDPAPPTDQLYTLDPATGTIQFDDRGRGQVPSLNSVIIARSYRYGGGAAGNVGARTIVTTPPGLVAVEVTNDRPASGGQDEESVDDLKERAPHFLRARGRAVTADDFRLAAEAVNGVLRARVLSEYHPDAPGAQVPGAVTVCVAPAGAAVAGGAPPTASEDLLRAVARALDKVRLITTEVLVISARYVGMNLSMDLDVDPEDSTTVVKRQVEDAVRRFFQLKPPKPAPGKAAPQGWDFGRKLYPSALYEVILRVEDTKRKKRLVRAVTRLEIKIDGVRDPLPPNESHPFGVDELPWVAGVDLRLPPSGPEGQEAPC
jgi:hypothetical protein